MRTRQVLVTGGSGIVGSPLVRRLAAAGFSVRVLSRRKRPVDHPNVTFHKGDILRLEDVRVALQGCAAVFHCAGEKLDPSTMTAINVTATRGLFDLARDRGVEFFCHLSSVGVIGKASTALVDESTPCNPTNLYEETKLAAEQIVLEGIGSGRVAILRPTNIFGAGALGPMLEHSFLATSRRMLKGNEHSHLVYAGDVAAAAEFCLRMQVPGRVQTFIVSSDEEPGGTHREVQAAAARLSKRVPRPPAFAAPRWLPHLLRALKGTRANRGDTVYSSQRLRAAGFQYPFGRLEGLRHALETPSDISHNA